MNEVVPNIYIIDYGMGNLKSVVNSLQYIGGCNVYISDDKTELAKADLLILPGVGAFKDAMKNIHERHLFDAINEMVLINKKPLLAICLGMQLLFEYSDEGEKTEGFGWIPGHVSKFKSLKNHRIPHMGWDNIKVKQRKELFKGIEEDPDFYFVHSYHVNCDDEYVVATCDYGYEFNAAVAKDNIVAFQFHPEKSYKNGLHLLENYLETFRDGLSC